MTEQTIEINLSNNKKEKPNPDQLSFGKVFTDHMFTVSYSEGKGWHEPKVTPYQPITLDPASMVFHYGQTVFEGLKAYLANDGRILLFRPKKNLERLNLSNQRLCIPTIDEELVLSGLKKLLEVDKEWIPNAPGTSLYIRPFIIPTEAFLGVAPSNHYQFMIILSPVGSYYKEGINPVKIYVEDQYVRAVSGGTGKAKTGGNYAASLKAQEGATSRGFSQVLWLDGVEKKYIEEVGSMNIFFKINGEVVTPALNESILEGVTRNSVLQLLKYWEIPVSERKISIEEVFESYSKGLVEEAFGTGTAAVISPVGELSWRGENIVINNGETGTIAKKLYDTLTGIQKGDVTDYFDWTISVDVK
ncbi:branched-chain amino acid aminotransferase [Litchfieldia salsa]|uniref:Branched-chain-amino-acid aminotransferase n=1 Tax=Litchfieldia salsa TaxID=930152 RepID=A0A1H0TCL3_9BACI|nr:branched-chain amino acid aminotransferase [Litchfieldia salsa]SDP51595.1 branched chain amino acid aminotransferase apoenzyme [Litchfieldia salsa]